MRFTLEELPAPKRVDPARDIQHDSLVVDEYGVVWCIDLHAISRGKEVTRKEVKAKDGRRVIGYEYPAYQMYLRANQLVRHHLGAWLRVERRTVKVYDRQILTDLAIAAGEPDQNSTNE